MYVIASGLHREFTLAEIEHFFNPSQREFPRVAEVDNIRCRVLSAQRQNEGEEDVEEFTIRELLDLQIVRNETLAYYMGRTQMFLNRMGARTDAVRFRQHRGNEMAHYASDCWDGEMLTSYVCRRFDDRKSFCVCMCDLEADCMNYLFPAVMPSIFPLFASFLFSFFFLTCIQGMD